MKNILTFLLLASFKFCIAQQQSSLNGKWQIISVAQTISPNKDSLFYDLNKDSIHLPAKDFADAKKDGIDSLQILSIIKRRYKSLAGGTFAFDRDSIKIEFNNTKILGTYKQVGDNTLYLYLNYGDKPEHSIYKFTLSENLLRLIMDAKPGYTTYLLKRI